MVYNGTFLKENSARRSISFRDRRNFASFSRRKLDDVLKFDDYKEIEVISALNHFSLYSDTFAEHELGYKLISYNAPVDEANEELMLCEQKICGAILLHFFQSIFKKN